MNYWIFDFTLKTNPMKNQPLFLLKQLSILLLFILRISNLNAQALTNDKRGMYVNNFLEVTDNGVIVNDFSMLGVDVGNDNVYEKEDALLEYAESLLLQNKLL